MGVGILTDVGAAEEHTTLTHGLASHEHATHHALEDPNRRRSPLAMDYDEATGNHYGGGKAVELLARELSTTTKGTTAERSGRALNLRSGSPGWHSMAHRWLILTLSLARNLSLSLSPNHNAR